jgi:hypothetical protein
MGLILEDASISVAIGPKWTGIAPTFGTGSSFMARAKRLHVNDKLEKADVHGAGSQFKAFRFFAEEQSLDLEGVVPATGFDYWADASTSPTGYWIQITTKELSSLTTSRVFQGVIEEWDWDASQGQPQMAKIKVALNPDYQ